MKNPTANTSYDNLVDIPDIVTDEARVCYLRDLLNERLVLVAQYEYSPQRYYDMLPRIEALRTRWRHLYRTWFPGYPQP